MVKFFGARMCNKPPRDPRLVGLHIQYDKPSGTFQLYSRFENKLLFLLETRSLHSRLTYLCSPIEVFLPFSCTLGETFPLIAATAFLDCSTWLDKSCSKYMYYYNYHNYYYNYHNDETYSKLEGKVWGNGGRISKK